MDWDLIENILSSVRITDIANGRNKRKEKPGQLGFVEKYRRATLRIEYCDITVSYNNVILTLILLMWRIGWAHNNARK